MVLAVANAPAPISVTLAGIAMDSIADESNALASMVMHALSASNVTVLSDDVRANAESAMVWTLAGIAMAVIADDRNALSPMVVHALVPANVTVVRDCVP